MPDLTPDTWAHIRAAYEHTNQPIADICAEHGISTGTLRDRVRRWRWTQRRRPVPQQGPPAVEAPQAFASPPPMSEANGGLGAGGAHAALTAEPPAPPAFAKASAGDPPHRFAGGGMSPVPPAADPAAIAARLQSAVARVLPAIEAATARLAAGPQTPREMEQTGRALGTMTRTLRELNALLAQQPARPALDDDMPEDIDAFRERLARKIEAFMESRSDEEFEEDEADER